MPASLKDLRSRIKSVKGTQQITKAMKLVSAAKFGRAQHNVIDSRPYATSISQMIAKLVAIMHGGCTHPFLNTPNSKTAVVISISSERGLCGGYNAYVAKQTIKTITSLESEGFQVASICIGKKAFQVLNRRHKLVLKKKEEATFVTETEYATPVTLIPASGLVSITTSFAKPTYSMAQNLAIALEDLYKNEKIGKIVLVYNKFQSALVQIPSSEVILPLQIPQMADSTQIAEPLFEPESDQLLTDLVPRYIASKIFHALLEATASEHGARMTAMDNATRNAKDMERKLQITYQRARQAAITKELIEIIGGAEAL